jgi:FlaA1/EpsC-like NDP-sugar epimerase
MEPPQGLLLTALSVGALCALGQVLIGSVLQLYRGRYVVGSFDEVWGVTLTTGMVGLIGTVILLFQPPSSLPRSSLVIGAVLAGSIMLAGRFALRAFRQRSALERDGARTLIYGAGDSGSQIVNLMLASPSSDFRPVGFLDDDPNKQRRRMRGLSVLGTIADLEDVVQTEGVGTLVVAIAGVTAPKLLELDRRCSAVGVNMRIIPTASEIVGGAVRLGDISNVTEEDLLGRHPVKTDEEQITAFLEGKRVLITGAGGSIGSELARQVFRYQPAFLGLLDRDESALHSVQLSLDGSGLLTAENLLLADIRDAARINEIFQDVRPDIVFHAAALKHLPLLERYPEEAYKTNVLGSRNVLRAAEGSGVQVFVNISTDKAADPVSVLGHSKLITERMAAGIPKSDSRRFLSVRFGNVLGSRGSVLETFRYQIAKGGPVTVTDERVTRYFMTVGEAVHLVLQASVLGSHAQTLILDMGSPVAIADVARYMIERSGRDIELVFTGLRPGEKLDEILIGSREEADRPLHPLISHTSVPGLTMSELSEESSGANARAVMEQLSSSSSLLAPHG